MEFTNQYLTYAEYKSLGGTLDEAPFNLLETEAQLNLDRYTFGRLKDLQEQKQEVKLCINTLISFIQHFLNINNSGNKLSENIDGYSVTYATLTAGLTDEQNKQISNVIKVYLSQCKLDDGTPYLYVGV